MRYQAVRWRMARRHRTPPRRRHWIRWTLLTVLLLVLATSGGTAAAGIYFVQHLPSVANFHIHYAFQDAHIYDSRGDLLYNMADLSRRNGGRRVVEPLQARNDTGNACRGGTNRIPLLLQNATIATEDATFYKNPGFDPLSIVRAAYQNLAYGHIVSGASTITQQVVRDNFMTTRERNQRTLNRKAREVELAYQVSKHFSKRKILWFYLNTVPYGNTAIGAQAAARVYFHTNVCSLNRAQAALLAGLPRAPTIYDPVRHRGEALTRLHEVLHLMRLHGYLRSKAQINGMMARARRWRFSRLKTYMRYPQYVHYVISQLQRYPAIHDHLYKGVDIYTTLDPRLQDLAQKTVSKQISGLTAYHVTDGALVSLDTRPQHYGWVLAMVGSSNYKSKSGQVNMAISPRQPGSSMKPFNYIWAFTHGHVAPGTDIVDAPIQLPDPDDPVDKGWYKPTNYDHQYHGTVTVRQALANSLNVPAVKVEYYVTSPRNVAATAFRFGMKSLYKDNPSLGCSVCWAVTLGGLTRGTRLIQETAAYGVFATGGRTVPPVTIWKVVKRNTGKVLYCSEDCPKGMKPTPWLAPHRAQVLDPSHAFLMTSILSDNNARCTVQVCEFGLNSPLLLNRPAAAKTGTTNAWTDNWTVGYTPQIVTGVWAGNADRSPMVGVIGVTGAAPIWHSYMEGAFKILKLPVENFVQPANVMPSSQCSVPNTAPASSGTTGTVPGYGVTDLQVAGDTPMCSLPDRGYAPYPCPTAGPSTGLYATPVPCYNGVPINPPVTNPYTQPYSTYQPTPVPAYPQYGYQQPTYPPPTG
jgi:membrane peptidoglycan carboxypeptidase